MGLRAYACMSCGEAFMTSALDEEDQQLCEDCNEK